jgi:O-antigen/teichoic acid export membrane protein
MLRRLGWGVADQAVSSLSNFAVNIYIAHDLQAVQYGAFALAYVTYGVVLQISRGLATDPLLVRFSGTDVPTWRRAVANCTGTAATVGLAASVCTLGAAAFLGGATREAFLALGLTLPGLMLQDSWRFAFFAIGRGSQAFLNDIIWVLALLPAMAYLRATGRDDVFWFILAWGAAAALGASVGPLQARLLPRLLGCHEWLSRHRDLGLRYVAEGTAGTFASLLRNYGIAAILGLASLGYVQAANTLMGPFQIILFGMGLVALPEAARILRNSPRHMNLFCIALSVGLTLAALGWGIVLLVAMPHGLGAWLLGPKWKPTYGLILPTTLFVMGGCASAGQGTYMHALGAAKRSLRAALYTAVLTVAFSLAGAGFSGATGTLDGAALATWLGSVIYLWQLRRALRDRGTPVASGTLGPPRHVGAHRKPAAGGALHASPEPGRRSPPPDATALD